MSSQTQIIPRGRVWNIGPGSTSLEILDYYLPAVLDYWKQTGFNLDYICQRFACQSEETEECRGPGGSFPGLRVGHIETVYDIVVNAAQARWNGQDIDDAIFQFVENKHRTILPGMRPGAWTLQQAQTQKAQTYFRAVAEVSSQTGSLPLGNILYRFFRREADRLLDGCSTYIALIWAHSIYQSCMHPREMNYCLQIIANNRPDVVQTLRQSYDRYLQLLGVALERSVDTCGGYQYEQWRPRQLPDIRRREVRSRSPSPIERRHWRTRGLQRHSRRRALSAPGHSRVARQAERVMDAAEDMYAKAEDLQRIAYYDD